MKIRAIIGLVSLGAVLTSTFGCFGEGDPKPKAKKKPAASEETKNDEVKKSSSDDDDEKAEDTVQATEPTEKTSVDAGKDAGRGPACTALATCCKALRDKGITGSANQCDRVVTTNEEYACSTVHADYKRPDEYYDPVCF